MIVQAEPSAEALADVCGALAWTAEAVFALEGRWAAEMTADAAVEHLAVHSRLHGWHAQLFRDLLPDSAALEGAAQVVAPAGWASALSVVDGLDDLEDAQRLTVLYRGLVPRAAAAVHRLRSTLVGPGSAAAARVTELVAFDQRRDLDGGTALLADALGDRERVGRAARALEALDQGFLNQ